MNKVQQEALSTLEGMAEEGYRTFTSKLIPSEGRRIIGVRIPRIRALAARIAKAGGLCDLMAPLPPSACYEMVMLKACAFAHLDGPSGEIQAQVLRFITEVDGWGSCDSLAASLKDARAHPDEWWPFVKKLFSHPYPYARRLAMVSCIWFFCDKEHLEEALSLIGRCPLSHFYERMGAAWALSMYFVRFPQRVGEFVEHGLSDRKVAAKAMSKVLESRQGSAADRAQARQIRGRIMGRASERVDA